MSKPPSSQRSELQQSAEPGCDWGGGLLLRQAWVFYPDIGL